MYKSLLLLGFVFSSFYLTAQVSSSGLNLLGHLPYPNATLAGCWHHVDSMGNEYALVGSSQGLSIVDMNDPTQPEERFMVPGLTNNWREVKTWGGFAYVGTEAINSGITIVDLRSLPDTVYYKTYMGDGLYDGQIVKSHALAATDGYLYIFGGALLTSGAVICSLADPWNPTVVGWYNANYLHDGFIRDDVLYGSEIYAGQFSVVDVSDKSNPQLLATQPTPGAFNHNTGLSDNSQFIFTTDEKMNAPLASFDISNLDNITLMDVYYPSQDPTREVHNVRVIDDFLINPSYGGQLTVVDAHKPDNLIETGWAVVGTSLVWDADPFLPSGVIFATAKNEGLFVFEFDYKQAAYLEGLVTDISTDLPLNNVKVFIENTVNADTSNVFGVYKTGALAGTYDVMVEKMGYIPQFIENVTLSEGMTTTLDIQMEPVTISAKSLDPNDIPVASPTLFKEQLLIQLPQGSVFNSSKATARIFNINGQLMLETPIEGIQTYLTNTGSLPAGQYVLFVSNDEAVSKPIRIIKGQ
ncbi:MAG: choice-of-anchor B family protein [Saprospiraceae bacterium]